MANRRAGKLAAALGLLFVLGCAATISDLAWAEGPSASDSLVLPGPARTHAVEAVVHSPGGGNSSASQPAENASRGASFLRAHVAARMQRFEGQDSDEVADAILAASRRAGIDPLLLLAIIEVESSFDPMARSDRNALGLMQVKPSTLWREARRSGLEGDDPHDPELNVAAGALYFGRLVRAFGPNDVALMAYNAGPNRILALIREGRIPDRLLEYPRRVRAVEARLRRALAVDSAGTAVARNDLGTGDASLE
jgi:soluble lytic murein transglycosylase-like protein